MRNPFKLALGILLLILVTTQGAFGQSAWSSGTTYSANQWVYYPNTTAGSAYSSLQNSNLNHQPDTSPTFWAPAVIIYESDSASYSNGIVHFGHQSASGVIPAGSCERPIIGGTAVATNSWQDTIKNAYGDGSRRFGLHAFYYTITSGGALVVTFTSGTCNTSGLTQAQMQTDITNLGDPFIKVCPAGGGTCVQKNMSTLLADTDPASNGECKDRIWESGPVRTTAIIEDCLPNTGSTGTKFDFGWHWDGTTMNANAGAAFTCDGNAAHCQYASNHPWFIASFDTTNHASIEWEPVYENDWTSRAQDQLVDLSFGYGSTTLWSQVGAKKVTDAVTTLNSKTITSATANFNSSMLGMPVSNPTESVYYWVYITKINSSTSIDVSLPCDGVIACNGGSGETIYIGQRSWGINPKKNFCIGACHNVLIDHNWAYMTSGTVKEFPPFDLTKNGDPEQHTDTSNGIISYADYSDPTAHLSKGEIGGDDSSPDFERDFDADSEIAVEQRLPLEYLTNMSSCGVTGGKCAKGWAFITGLVGARDTASIGNGAVVGGAGFWGALGNVTTHGRESQTTATGIVSTGNKFYCPNLAEKNAKIDGTNPVTGVNGCGTGVGDAGGRSVSVYAHSDQGSSIGSPPVAAVGSITSGGYADGTGCAHWLEYAYDQYHLTGDFWALTQMYQSASFCNMVVNPDNCIYCRGKFFAYGNPAGATVRSIAAAIQVNTRAAYSAPDGTAEQLHYRSLLDSNLEVQAGMFDITSDAAITPSDTTCHNSTVASFDWTTPNRWNWGACVIRSSCYPGPSWFPSNPNTCTKVPNKLHMAATGACPLSGGGDALGGANPAIAGAFYLNWAEHNIGLYSAEAYDFGYTEALGVLNETLTQLVEVLQVPTYNPFMAALGNAPIKDVASGSCDLVFQGGSNQPFNSTYADLLKGAWAGHTGTATTASITGISCSGTTVTVTANQTWSTGDYVAIAGVTPSGYNATHKMIFNGNPFPPTTSFTYQLASCPGAYVSGGTATVETVNTYDYVQSVGNAGCGDHGYAGIARALAQYFTQFNTSSTDAQCPSGLCSGATALSWINTNAPYWSNSPPTSDNCSLLGDTQIKLSIAPRSGLAPAPTITACNSLSPSSATINTSATQNFTASCTYSDSSTGDCTSSLVLSSGSPSVATVSSQTATGVSAGSSTISGTANSFACGNTSALTVQNPATQTIKITGGTSLSKGTILK